jgi:hypothetical protein
MALLHRATLTPSKVDLIAKYLATQPYASDEDRTDLAAVGSYRFDDPAGEVGIETHLVAGASGTTLHLPLTYRSAPLPGAEDWLVGTIEHSVLGPRWVYNGCGDPIYVTALLRAMIKAESQVDQYFETEAGREYRQSTAAVVGSGVDMPIPTVGSVSAVLRNGQTHIDADGLAVVVRHVFEDPTPPQPTATLIGEWATTDSPVVVAYF